MRVYSICGPAEERYYRRALELNPKFPYGAIGLEDAASSLCDYLRTHDLHDIRLVGHSYGGMVISRVADLMPERIRRLVYVNAFVPLPGESLNDMAPPH